MATDSCKISWQQTIIWTLVLIVSGCVSAPAPRPMAIHECRVSPPSYEDLQQAVASAVGSNEADSRLFWTSVDEAAMERHLSKPPMASGQLFSIKPLSVRPPGQDCLHESAAQDLFHMAHAYSRKFLGRKLDVYSAYRSPLDQITRSIISTRNKLINRGLDSSWTSVFASVAPPGYSDHQTGYALDLFEPDADRILQNREAFDWLAENAHRFGFELRYPHCNRSLNEGKFIREPWHYLWKGVGVAAKKSLDLDCVITPSPRELQPSVTTEISDLNDEPITCSADALQQVHDGDRTRDVYGAQNFLFFRSGLRVNTDGSPNSYHPDGTPAGALNTLCNALAVYPSSGPYAGQRISSIAPSNIDAGVRCQIILDTFRAARTTDYASSPLGRIDWYALAMTSGDDVEPRPCIQKEGRYKNFFVSQTHLSADPSRHACDLSRWVDSTTIPYITLPSESRIFGDLHVNPGDLALVHRRIQGKDLLVAAVFADTGNKEELGEGSIALHRALGNEMSSGSMRQNLRGEVSTFVFPRIRAKVPLTQEWISEPSLKEDLISKAGGRANLLACIERAERDAN